MADVGVAMRSLEEYPELPEIVEDGASFLENALKKAKTTAEFTGEIALADDSGLEVAALDGAPGIYSSRYAGDGADDADNIRKLLNDLRGFRPPREGPPSGASSSCIGPMGAMKPLRASGRGGSRKSRQGRAVSAMIRFFSFRSRGVTVAQLAPDVKNRISHRAQAFAKLKVWLQKESQENGA